MVTTLENLKRRVAEGDFHYENEKAEADELCKAAVALEGWRASMLDGQFKGTMKRLLEIIGQVGPETEQVSNSMIDWLEQAAPIIDKVKRGPGFWIDLMRSDLQSPPPRPPDGRVLDIQGWLELFHEPGSHLVLCGMNEGKIPARSGGEPWLSESSRERLGLIMDSERASRDAFLYHSMLESRRVGGRVDVICGKSAAAGEPLLPSRVLLACERDALPDRVESLFKEVEPPDAGLRWHDDFKWQIPAAAPPKKIGVTSLSDYLSCPFRYYLKHVQRMRSSDPTRSEWSARDFGNVAHEVLERWGTDVDARNIDDAESLHRRFTEELDRVVAEWFGKRVPLAIRIQKETLWHRFQWVAATQAKLHAEGWRTIDVERKFLLTFGQSVITGKIDRIDRHHETGQLRVIDYKSGDVGGVIQAHRKKVSESSTLPSHLSRDCPAVYQDEEKGKTVEFLWHNLQLPLYALSLVEAGEPLPEPCYFTLGATESKVELHRWDGFDMNDLTAAKSCTTWVVEQIHQKVFMPPAEKVTYDDYAVLAAGRTLGEMIES
jgi:ATP-dependent helicase/nuclease subunit B